MSARDDYPLTAVGEREFGRGGEISAALDEIDRLRGEIAWLAPVFEAAVAVIRASNPETRHLAPPLTQRLIDAVDEAEGGREATAMLDEIDRLRVVAEAAKEWRGAHSYDCDAVDALVAAVDALVAAGSVAPDNTRP